MIPAAVQSVLERRIGLDPDSLGTTAAGKAVAERCQTRGLVDPIAYAALLEHDAAEFMSLVELLVVPETWFFRGGGLFDFLARHALEVHSQRDTRKPVRVLSLPCSTGEEPYSLAIR